MAWEVTCFIVRFDEQRHREASISSTGAAQITAALSPRGTFEAPFLPKASIRILFFPTAPEAQVAWDLVDYFPSNLAVVLATLRIAMRKFLYRIEPFVDKHAEVAGVDEVT